MTTTMVVPIEEYDAISFDGIENLDLTDETRRPLKSPRTKRLRAAAYPRCSDPGLEDSKTLESQEKDIWRFVNVNKQYVLVKERVFPEAISAYNKPFREREVFSKIISAAKRGEIDVLLVTEYSRLSRRQIEQAVIIYILEQLGVKVVSITEQIEDTPLGTFMRAVYAFVSELEREKTFYRTQRGKKDRIEDGNISGQGYTRYALRWIDTADYRKARYVAEDSVICVIDDIAWSEIDVLRYLFLQSYNGISTRQIALALTRLGVPTKRGMACWSQQTVYNILTDPVYKGMCYVNRFIKVNGTSRLRPREDWILLPEGTAPTLIDPEFFDDVQDQLERNKKESFRNGSQDNSNALLRAGYVMCGICGKHMHTRGNTAYKHVIRGKAYSYKPEYFCTVNTGIDDLKHHHSVSIAQETLDVAAWQFAVNVITSPQLLREKLDEIRKDFTLTVYSTEIEATLVDVKRRIRNLTRLAASSEDEETFGEIEGLLKNYEKEKQEAEVMLNDAMDNETFNAQLEEELIRFERWCLSFAKRMDSEPTTYIEKRRAIAILGVQAIVSKKGMPGGRVQLELSPSRIVNVISGSR